MEAGWISLFTNPYPHSWESPAVRWITPCPVNASGRSPLFPVHGQNISAKQNSSQNSSLGPDASQSGRQNKSCLMNMEQGKGGRERGEHQGFIERSKWRSQLSTPELQISMIPAGWGRYLGRNGHFGKANSLRVRTAVSELIPSLASKRGKRLGHAQGFLKCSIYPVLGWWLLAVFMGSALTPG